MGSTYRVPSPVPAHNAGVAAIGPGPVLRDGSLLWMKLGDPQFPCAMVYESYDHYRAFCAQCVDDWNKANSVVHLLRELGCDVEEARAVVEKAVDMMAFAKSFAKSFADGPTDE